MQFICVRRTKSLLRKHRRSIFWSGKVRGTENSGTAAITRPINWPKINLYRRGSFILRLHIWTSVTTVYKLIRKLIDRSIMCPGNRVTFEIIPFSVLLNCPMGQRKKKKREKRTNNIEREERKIMENTIKGENSGQWRSSADTNSHRG